MNSRNLYVEHAIAALATIIIMATAEVAQAADREPACPEESGLVTLFLCGDVMTGRGIDQVLPHPSDPRIYEGYMRSALGYVRLAEDAHGAIEKPVEFDYLWGDALDILERIAPDARIINLETAVTASDDYWKGKAINYRMHPRNVPCLKAAGIDCAVLANNHVLDWGYGGLEETLTSLEDAGIVTAGAGRNLAKAEAPAVIDLAGDARVLVYGLGSWTSGIPSAWAATRKRAGLHFLENFSNRTVDHIADNVRGVLREKDIVVASIHWGSNWGYRIPREHRDFAHRLIDEAQVDVVHGHSSHHPRAIEIYRGKPIFYGCGDFLNDYEGIRGHEEFRGDLGFMYFVTMDASSGKLARLEMIPTQVRKFQIRRPSQADARWLEKMMRRQCAQFEGSIQSESEGGFALRWNDADD